MSSFVLYTTLGCHLCEQALELITVLLPDGSELRQVDISDTDLLTERYGTRIPVIARTDTNNELGWPFDQEDFLSFIK